MIEHRVYLVGYAGRKPSELQAACARLGARLVDVRLSPRSRRPEWNRGPVQRVFGDRYRHCPAFGNEAYKTGGVMLLDPEAGVAEVAAMLAESSVVLMCQCKDGATCHRAVVGALLRERLGVEVIELDEALAESEPQQMGLFGGAA